MSKRAEAILASGFFSEYVGEAFSVEEQRMLLHGRESILRVLAYNPSLVEEFQVELSDNPDVPCVMNLASNPSLVPSVQVKLASHPDKYVRSVMAGRESLDPSVFLTLAGDTERFVRQDLAGRFDLSPECQVLLAADPSVDVRRVLARCDVDVNRVTKKQTVEGKELCPEAQRILMRDAAVEVRDPLARHPELTDDVKIFLAGDSDGLVKRTLAGLHRDLPFEAVVKLSADRSLSAEHYVLPLVRPHLERVEHLNAMFVYRHFKGTFFKLVEGVDQEVLDGLLEGWSGSARDLAEACKLVRL